MSFPPRLRGPCAALRSLSAGIGALAAIVCLSGAGAFAAAGDSPPAAGTGIHPARSAGCATHAAAGRSKLSTLDGNRRARTFLIDVPADYDPSKPYALAFVFHGSGGSSSVSYSWGLQRAAGAAASAIFVFPDGIAYRHYGVGWDDTATGYDLPFFDNMLKDIAAAYCIDPARIFAAGFSWGGDFVIALACNRGDEIRAIAANSTNDEYRDTSDYLTYQNLPCPSRKRPAVRFQHALGGDSAYPPPDFATTSKLFQYLNACPAAAAGSTSASTSTSTSTSAREQAGGGSCVTYRGCASEYVECAFDPKIGHALPPHWAEDTWAFFAGHSN